MTNKQLIVLVLLLTFVSLGGCATTTRFTSIPTTNEEFTQPIAKLRDKYTDVALYEPKAFNWSETFTLKSRTPRPPINALEGQWGSPQRTERKWGEWSASIIPIWVLGAVTGMWWVSGVTTIVFLPPVETHHWSKGTSHIEARVTHALFHGYEGRLASWQWSEEQPTAATQNNVPEQRKTVE